MVRQGSCFAVLVGLIGSCQQQAAAISLSWQGNGTLGAVLGSPLEESKPVWVKEWLKGFPRHLRGARDDAAANWGPSRFPTLQSYMDQCHTSEPDAVKIQRWMGRVGNRLWQVINAVRIAEATGRRFVKLPDLNPPPDPDPFAGTWTGGLEADLFDDKPESRVIEIAPSKSRGACEFIPVSGQMYKGQPSCRFTYFNRCRMTVKERKDIYQTYILPLLRKDVTNECEAGADDEITIHLRNGDVALLNDLNPAMRSEHRQPPCAYFHKVIQTGHNGGPFKRVQLVYSHEDPKSPCIDDILAKHTDKVVLKAASSQRGDVCHILRAKNLALTMSSFGTSLKMLSSGLHRLFFVNMLVPSIMTKEQYDIQEDYYEFSVKELCEVFPAVTSYSAPDLYLNDAFFTTFPDSSLKPETCSSVASGR